MEKIKELEKASSRLEAQRKAVRLLLQASDLLDDMIKKESEK